jgi:hypothetical protein
MTTTLDRAIEDAQRRGVPPEIIAAIRSLAEKGKAAVRQGESGEFRFFQPTDQGCAG